MDVGCASAEGPAKTQKKVIIVGAGIAGISAAREVCKSREFDVKILEASHRVGGRALSIEVDGVPVELGATFIHGTTANVIYDLAKSYGLVCESTEEPAFSMSAVLSNGDAIPNETVVKCWNKWSILTNDELDHDYIDSQPQVGKYKDLYDYYAGEYPKLMKEDHATIEVLSIPAYYDSIFECFVRFESVSEGLKDCKDVNLYDDFIFLPGNPEFRFDKGYGSLFNRLVKDLPKDTILYGREVVGINVQNDLVLIRCRNGDEFEADHVIITVSLGVFKRRCLYENLLPNEFPLFTPPLPVEKQEAIRNLGFGQIAKIVLQFDQEIFCQHNSQSLMMLWLAEDKDDSVIKQKFPWATELCVLDRIRDSNLYESWITGSTVIEVERATKDNIREAFSYVLSKMLRRPVSKPVDVYMHSWVSDSLFGGCYTANLANVDTSAFILSLEKPLINNRVLFAGEATSVEFYSTVHGAYCTGVREAKRLRDMYHF